MNQLWRFGVGTFAALSLSAPAFAQQLSEKTSVPLAQQTTLTQSQAGFYRTKLGSIDVIALSDGSVGLGIADGFVLNGKPGEVAALLRRNYQTSPVDASVNAYLIRLGERLILIDAGSGALIGPTGNKLPQSLKAVGVNPADVTDIFITHIHSDHSGGLMFGGKRVFPNATVHIEKREVDHWLDKSLAARAAGLQQALFAQAQATIPPYIASGQLKTFDGATVFFPGFRAEPSSGHTPGHTSYVLEDSGQKMAFVGDVIGLLFEFDDPGLTLGFDSDPAATVARRRLVLKDAAANGYLLVPAHAPFPGIGHVRTNGDHYDWVPIDYVNDAVGS